MSNASIHMDDATALSDNSMVDISAKLLAKYDQDEQYGEKGTAVEEGLIDQPEVEEEEGEEVAAEAETVEVEAETEEADDADEAPGNFETIAEIAEAAGVDLEELISTVKISTKVDGKEGEATLADLRKSYQLEASQTRKAQALADDRKAFEAEQAEAQAKLNAELERAGAAFAMAQRELLNEFNSQDWQKLQAEDPTRFIMERQRYGERQAQLNQAIQQATEQAKRVKAEQEQKAAAQREKELANQSEMLIAAIPEWRDESKREAGARAVSEFLLSRGFAPDEVGGITDHRIILMAQDAMKAANVATDTDLAKKKVRDAPKLVKPGAKPQVNAKGQEVARLKKQLKKSGDIDDLSRLLMARG